MFVRLFQVILAFVALSFVVRIFRSFRRPSEPAQRRTPASRLDPTKQVAAKWSEVPSDGEGGKADSTAS